MRKPCCNNKEGGANNKGAWSKQEDQKLIDHIKLHGEGNWRSLPKAAGLDRCGKSCRLRWINYLRPDIKRGNFAQDEEDLIIKLHAMLGNRWSLIAGRLPGRTDNEVKNYWNSHIRRKLISMGIDPSNHRLNQVLPRPNDHIHPGSNSPTTTRTTFSEGKKASNINNKIKEPNKPLLVVNHNPNHPSTENEHGPVSKAASCLEQDLTILASSSDLNLNLSIAFPNSSTFKLTDHETLINRNMDNSMMVRKVESHDQTSPTLLLFT